jgi:hypothetical protein
MVLLLLTDGSLVEIEQCEDVVHKPGTLVCVDYLGAPIASFLDDHVLGYTLNPGLVRIVKETPRELLRKPAASEA